MERKRILPVTENEFLTLNHRALNDSRLNIESCVDESQELKNCLNGKEPVPCLEGDLVPVKETREVVLAHKGIFPLTRSEYEHLREAGLASPLNKALDKVADYRQKTNQRVSVFLDLKPSTDEKTIQETLKQLQIRGLTDVIFNSFDGRQLDKLYDNGVKFPRSFNRFGKLGRIKLYLPFQAPKRGYDFVTQFVTYPRKADEPTLYGGITSKEKLKKVAEVPLAIGAGLRLKEGNILGIIRSSLSSRL